jgi:hypothetical protein
MFDGAGINYLPEFVSVINRSSFYCKGDDISLALS